MFGRSGGYTYADIGGETRQQRPITAADLVDAGGACPARPAPAQPQPATGNQGAVPAASADATSAYGAGIALGMSECDVVDRAGKPSSVELGRTPNGDRSAVMTFRSGPRPGLYHFERGKLMEMDSVDVPPSPPAPAQQVKKKPASSNKPVRKDDAA